MDLLTPATLAIYLREKKLVDPAARLEIRELSGGVSNVTLCVSRPGDENSDVVVKQARERLAVAEEWLCDPARILREVEVLRCIGSMLSLPVTHGDLYLRVPMVGFVDEENFIYGMTAAPRSHAVWKTQLLDGDVRPEIGGACGLFLALIHGSSWNHPEIAEQFDDAEFFDLLRVDPYYRHLARHDAELGPGIDELIVSLAQNRVALVHGDFSPKNLLVDAEGITLIDCEVGHFGDPAFDVGFFLAHLVLKAFRVAPRHAALLKTIEEFVAEYLGNLGRMWQMLPDPRTIPGDEVPEEAFRLMGRVQRNLGGCLLARLAGKSPVDYLVEPNRRAAVDRLGRKLLLGPLVVESFLVDVIAEELSQFNS